MPSPKKDVPGRKVKSRSAAQKAKAEANVKAAQERLRLLQAKQRICHETRKARGIMADDATILRILSEEERLNEAVAAREYVNSVLSGPYGDRVKKWVGTGLTGNPVKVASVIRNYLRTQGWNEAA